MKLRVANAQNRYWVEQKRWFGSWRICHRYVRGNDFSDLLELALKYTGIKFFQTSRESDSFQSYDEAFDYSKMWWLSFSFKARRLRKRELRLRSLIGQPTYKMFKTSDFIKSQTIDKLKER